MIISKEGWGTAAASSAGQPSPLATTPTRPTRGREKEGHEGESFHFRIRALALGIGVIRIHKYKRSGKQNKTKNGNFRSQSQVAHLNCGPNNRALGGGGWGTLLWRNSREGQSFLQEVEPVSSLDLHGSCAGRDWSQMNVPFFPSSTCHFSVRSGPRESALPPPVS